MATSNCLEEKEMFIILPFKWKIGIHDKWNPHVGFKYFVDDVHLYILIKDENTDSGWHPHVFLKRALGLLSQQGNFQIFTCLTSFKSDALQLTS